MLSSAPYPSLCYNSPMSQPISYAVTRAADSGLQGYPLRFSEPPA